MPGPFPTKSVVLLPSDGADGLVPQTEALRVTVSPGVVSRVWGTDSTGVHVQQTYGHGGLLITPPSGFGWDFVTYPLNIYKDGPRHFTTDFNSRSMVAASIWSGPTYYVAYNGNNSNNGLSAAAPFRSLWKARATAEADGAVVGYKIAALVDPSAGFTYWDRANDFNDTANAGGSGGNVTPTKPFALMSYGGRSYMGPIAAGLSYVDDGSGKATYSVSRANVSTVIDIKNLNAWGIQNRMTKVADQATCQNTPGSWAQVSSTLYVHMLNGEVPSDANVKVVLTTSDALKLGVPDAYVSGFALFGGANGALNASTAGAGSRRVILEDCDFSHAGPQGGTATNGASMANGFFGLVRCSGSDCLADIFNGHSTSGDLHILGIDLVGVDAGHAGSSPQNLSNQIFTMHETTRAITLNTRGRLSAGGLVRNIGQSQHWDLGSEYFYDRGDLMYASGAQPSTGVVINDTSKYWGDSVTVGGCLQSFYADSTAEIRLRDPVELGGTRAGAGLITSY